MRGDHNITKAALEKGEETFSVIAGGKDNILGSTLDAVAHSTSLEGIEPTRQSNGQFCEDWEYTQPDRTGEPTTLENCYSHFKHFARDGIPDPRDLRGVSLTEAMSRTLLICSPRERFHRFRHTTLSSSTPISTMTTKHRLTSIRHPIVYMLCLYRQDAAGDQLIRQLRNFRLQWSVGRGA